MSSKVWLRFCSIGCAPVKWLYKLQNGLKSKSLRRFFMVLVIVWVSLDTNCNALHICSHDTENIHSTQFKQQNQNYYRQNLKTKLQTSAWTENDPIFHIQIVSWLSLRFSRSINYAIFTKQNTATSTLQKKNLLIVDNEI